MTHSAHPTDAIPVGTTVTFARTVTEEGILRFAEVSGDFSPNHVDPEYTATTPYGRVVAHGVLTMGLMSACSSKLHTERAGRAMHLARVRPAALPERQAHGTGSMDG